MSSRPVDPQNESARVPSAKIARLSLARLREILDYDPGTGIFTWRVRLSPRGGPGERAGALTAQGYRRIGIGGVQYLEHQLAWLMHYGTEPPPNLDHKNTLKFDNRIANLRAATMSQNAMNRNPTTAFKGVKFQYGRYHASIRPGRGRERLYLGCFATAEAAHAAYCARAAELHGDFMRVKMTTLETRRQIRDWAKDKPEVIQNRASVLRWQLRLLEQTNTPLMRSIVAASMERLRA